MGQIALAWSTKKATAPIIGATRLNNVELTDEGLAYMKEPHKSNPVMGHT